MLTKLYKQEWKQSWKLPTIISIVAIIISIISMISFHTPIMDNHDSMIVFVIEFMFFIMAFLVLAVSSICVYGYFSIRFYKNFYTDEGYLMHTLPVTPNQLILSKFLVFFTWIILQSIIILVCYLGVVLSLNNAIDMGITNVFNEIYNTIKAYGISNLYSDLNILCVKNSGLPLWFMLIILFLMILISACNQILTPYFAISLGQLVSKYKLGASIGFYLGIITLVQMITMIITVPLSLLVSLKMEQNDEYSIWFFYANYGSQFLILIICTVLFYFFTHKIMKSHLNLD